MATVFVVPDDSHATPKVRQTVTTEFGDVNVPRAGSKTRPIFPIPPRDANAGTNQIDLGSLYNVALVESWQPIRTSLQADLSLKALLYGTRDFAGVVFDARGLVQLRRSSADCAMFPDRVSIPLGRKLSRFHVLHGTRWEGLEGKPVGSFVLHYTDGSDAETPIVYGDHLLCELAVKNPTHSCKAADLAWSGPDPTGRSEYLFRVFKAKFENPRPDREVAWIDYTSKVGKAAPFLVALTVE
jgi:hypothetical protein